jgi:hypothetical protein
LAECSLLGRTGHAAFNLINLGERQGTPLVDMPADDFVRPVRTAMTTNRFGNGHNRNQSRSESAGDGFG